MALIDIQLTAIGILDEYLPPNAAGDTAVVQTQAQQTVRGLLASLNMPWQHGLVVSVNDTVVKQADHPTRILHAGDRVLVMPPLKGG